MTKFVGVHVEKASLPSVRRKSTARRDAPTQQLSDEREVVTWGWHLALVARSGDTAATPHPEAFSDGSTVVWSNRSTVGLNPDGSTPGALPGNYPLDYDENGFPELPACLDRREPPALKAAA